MVPRIVSDVSFSSMLAGKGEKALCAMSEVKCNAGVRSWTRTAKVKNVGRWAAESEEKVKTMDECSYWRVVSWFKQHGRQTSTIRSYRT